MDMSTWAEKEIELACKHENPNWDGKSFDYGCSCYQSALKAYNSLLEDEHSGFSIILTKHILNRLIDHKPLTPITEEDFIANENTIHESDEYLKEKGLKSSIQCPRYSALFRYESLDGTVTYMDVDRYYCFNVNDKQDVFTGGRFSKIIDEYFPITLPYFPTEKKYRIAVEEVCVDPSLGDFDTTAIWYILTPEDEKIEVNKFYKEIKVGEIITKSYETASYIDENGNEIKGDIQYYEYQPTEEVEITLEEFNNRKELIK